MWSLFPIEVEFPQTFPTAILALHGPGYGAVKLAAIKTGGGGEHSLEELVVGANVGNYRVMGCTRF